MFKTAPIKLERFVPKQEDGEKIELYTTATRMLKTVFMLASSKETRQKDFPGSNHRDAFELYFLDLVAGTGDKQLAAAIRDRRKIMIFQAVHFEWRVANSSLQDEMHGLESEEQVLVAKAKYDARVREEKQRVQQDEQQASLASVLQASAAALSGSQRKGSPGKAKAKAEFSPIKTKKKDAKAENLPPLPLLAESKEE